MKSYMPIIDKNFDERNGQLYLKLFNNRSIDETEGLYKLTVDIDRLLIFIKDGMKNHIIDNSNLNIKLIKK